MLSAKEFLEQLQQNTTEDDTFSPSTELTRQSAGRSTAETTQARRLRVFDLWCGGLTRQIYDYVESLGFSRATALDDIRWCKAEWKEINQDQDTAQEIIEKHTTRYNTWAREAELSGDLKLAKEMLQAVEKLKGFHQANVAVQVNSGFVQNNTQVNNTIYEYDRLTLEEQLQLLELTTKAMPLELNAATR